MLEHLAAQPGDLCLGLKPALQGRCRQRAAGTAQRVAHLGKNAAHRGGQTTFSRCGRSSWLLGLSTPSASASRSCPAAAQASLCACVCVVYQAIQQTGQGHGMLGVETLLSRTWSVHGHAGSQ